MDPQLELLARSRIKTVFKILGRPCSKLTPWHLMVIETLGIGSVLTPRPLAQDLRLAVVVVSTPPDQLAKKLKTGLRYFLWCAWSTWTNTRNDTLRKWVAFLSQNMNFPRVRPVAAAAGAGRRGRNRGGTGAGRLNQPGMLTRISQMIAISPGVDEDALWNRAIDELAWSVQATAEAAGKGGSFLTAADIALEEHVKNEPAPDPEAVAEYQRMQKERAARMAGRAKGEFKG